MFKKTYLAPPPAPSSGGGGDEDEEDGPTEEEEEEGADNASGTGRPRPAPIGDSCPGCSSKTAGDACYTIKDLNPSKKNGFYWVKPKCSKTSLRVYCDYNTKWE